MLDLDVSESPTFAGISELWLGRHDWVSSAAPQISATPSIALHPGNEEDAYER